MSSHVTVSSLLFRVRIRRTRESKGPEVRLQQKEIKVKTASLPALTSLDLASILVVVSVPQQQTVSSSLLLFLLLLFLCLTLPSSAAFLFPFVLFNVLVGNFGNQENISILSPFHFVLG